MTTTATREDTWVSIAEAAEQLGVHPRTLRRYIRDGKLAVHRLSPQVVRIDQEALGAFLGANIKVTTGTGVCYVPNPEPAPAAVVEVPVVRTPRVPKAVPPARYSG